MTTALGLAGAAVGALAALSIVTGLGPYHLAVSAAGLLGLMGGVVLTGRDYADSGSVLGRVHGVHSIVRELVEMTP
jgi:hypothetical protein